MSNSEFGDCFAALSCGRRTLSGTGLRPTSRRDHGASTIRDGDTFLYVGCAYKHRGEANPRVSGVFGRLGAHVSGARSGNQFAIYICDRFVVPYLTVDQREALTCGERLLDS